MTIDNKFWVNFYNEDVPHLFKKNINLYDICSYLYEDESGRILRPDTLEVVANTRFDINKGGILIKYGKPMSISKSKKPCVDNFGYVRDNMTRYEVTGYPVLCGDINISSRDIPMHISKALAQDDFIKDRIEIDNEKYNVLFVNGYIPKRSKYIFRDAHGVTSRYVATNIINRIDHISSCK